MRIIPSSDGRETVVGGELFNAANEAVKMAVLSTRNRPTGMYYGVMAALGALIPSAQLMGKLPETVNENSPVTEQHAAIVSVTNKDTILLAALLAAEIFEDAEAKFDSDGDPSEAINSEYGPEKMVAAVENWKKLTGKDPYDVFHRDTVDGPKAAVAKAAMPFKDFLAQRGAVAAPGTGTAQ